MPTVTNGDVSVYYETHGSGEPLLLIPGMLSDGASWGPLVPTLSKWFEVILIDTRGAGQTEPKTAPLKLAHVAQDALAVLDALGHDRAHVAGHSMGGLVALALAGATPERVISVLALATSPAPAARIPAIFRQLCSMRADHPDDTLWLKSLFTWLFADAFFWQPEQMAEAVQASLEYPHLQSLEAMQHQTKSLARLDVSSVPDRLEVPAMALLAEEDALILHSSALAAFAKMGIPAVAIPKAGHSLHWDQPEQTSDVMTAFFIRHSSGTRQDA